MDYIEQFYKRLTELRIQKGVSARDINPFKTEEVIQEFQKLSPEYAEHILQIIKDLNSK